MKRREVVILLLLLILGFILNRCGAFKDARDSLWGVALNGERIAYSHFASQFPQDESPVICSPARGMKILGVSAEFWIPRRASHNESLFSLATAFQRKSRAPVEFREWRLDEWQGV